MPFQPLTYIDNESLQNLELKDFENEIDILDINIVKLMSNDQFEKYIKYYKQSDIEYKDSSECNKLQHFFVKVEKKSPGWRETIDIDLSFYAKNKFKKIIFDFDFKSEYFKNIAEIKKCKYGIDNNTFSNHIFEFNFKYIPIYTELVSGLNWIKKGYSDDTIITGTELKLSDNDIVLQELRKKTIIDSSFWNKNGRLISKNHYIKDYDNNFYYVPEEDFVYENININNEKINYYKVKFKINKDLSNLDEITIDNISDFSINFYNNLDKIITGEDINNISLTLYKYDDKNNESIKKITNHIKNYIADNFNNLEGLSIKENSSGEKLSYYSILALSYNELYKKIILNIYILYSLFYYFDSIKKYKYTLKEDINKIIENDINLILKNFYNLLDVDSEGSIKSILIKNTEKKYVKMKNKEKQIELIDNDIKKKEKDLESYNKDESNHIAHYSEWKKKDEDGIEFQGFTKLKHYLGILEKNGYPFIIDKKRYKMFNIENKKIYMNNYIKIDKKKFFPLKSSYQYYNEKKIEELQIIKKNIQDGNFIKEESQQILEAKKYKNELSEINEVIEKEKKENNKSKKIINYNESYINNIDISLYFIIFIFIIIIFLFVFDYTLININISIPIILISIIILIFLFLTFIKNKYNSTPKKYNFLDILFKNKVIEDFFDTSTCDKFIINDNDIKRYNNIINYYCDTSKFNDLFTNFINIEILINEYLYTDENNIFYILINDKYYFDPSYYDGYTLLKFNKDLEYNEGTDYKGNYKDSYTFSTNYKKIFENELNNYEIKYDDVDNINDEYLVFIHDQNNIKNTKYKLNLPKNVDLNVEIIAIGGGAPGYSFYDKTINDKGKGGKGGQISKKDLILYGGLYEIIVSDGGNPGDSLKTYMTNNKDETIIEATNSDTESDGVIFNGGRGGASDKLFPTSGIIYSHEGEGEDNVFAEQGDYDFDDLKIAQEDDPNGEEGINIYTDYGFKNTVFNHNTYSSGGGSLALFDNSKEYYKNIDGLKYIKLSTKTDADKYINRWYNYNSAKKFEDKAPHHTGGGGSGSEMENEMGNNGGSGILIIKYNKEELQNKINLNIDKLTYKILKESYENRLTILENEKETNKYSFEDKKSEYDNLYNEIKGFYGDIENSDYLLEQIKNDIKDKKNKIETNEINNWKMIKDNEVDDLLEKNKITDSDAIDYFIMNVNKKPDDFINIDDEYKDFIDVGIQKFIDETDLDIDIDKIYFEISIDDIKYHYKKFPLGFINHIDKLKTKIEIIEKDILNKDFAKLKDKKKEYLKDYNEHLEEIEKNKEEIAEINKNVLYYQTEKDSKDLEFAELKKKYHNKIKQFIEYKTCSLALETALYDDEEGTYTKLTNSKDENEKIIQAHYAKNNAEKAKKRIELRKLTNLRDLAIQEIIKYEKEYDDELKKFIKTYKKYGVSYINLKLAIDYKFAGFDLNSSDEKTNEDIEKILNGEREKRIKFINIILRDLIKGTEELNDDNDEDVYNITQNRFEILRIYPEKNTTPFSTEYNMDHFHNFQVKEHFSEVDDNNCINLEEEKCNSDCEWYPEYEICSIKGNALGSTTLYSYESAERYLPEDDIIIISIKINPHYKTINGYEIKPTSNEIMNNIKVNAGDIKSKLRLETKYLRYIIGTQIFSDTNGIMEDWVDTPRASKITIYNEKNDDNIKIMKLIIDDIDYIIDYSYDDEIDDESYYDTVNNYVKKEYNDYKDNEKKLLLNSKRNDNIKNINYYDIRIKELLHQYILCISLIICISIILNKFIFRSVIFVILIITIILISVYYISGIILVMNTKSKNRYWKKPDKY